MARDLENLQPDKVREEFQKYSADALKEYLQMMDSQVSTQGRQFRKDKLSRLAFACFQLYVKEEGDTEGNEKRENLIKSKHIIDDGTQLLLIVDLVKDPSKWSKDINDFPVFIYPDLYSYFLNKPGYDKESLKAYKALTGYKLMNDGYVWDLGIYNVAEMDYMFIKFQVKPTQKTLTMDKKKYYESWVIMKRDGEVITAHNECLGSYDGACRHVAAGLFEIERTIREDVAKPSVTEGPCLWKKRKEVDTNSVEVKKLAIERRSLESDGSLKKW